MVGEFPSLDSESFAGSQEYTQSKLLFTYRNEGSDDGTIIFGGEFASKILHASVARLKKNLVESARGYYDCCIFLAVQTKSRKKYKKRKKQE